jgi:hypothetical protein
MDDTKSATANEEPEDYLKPKGKPSFSMPAFISQIQHEVMLGGSKEAEN